MLVAIRLGQLDVHAGAHGERRGLLAVVGEVMPVELGPFVRAREWRSSRRRRCRAKPHSLRSTSRSSQRLACDGTPSISLYEAITLIAPPSRIAAWNGAEKLSRSMRSETFTGRTVGAGLGLAVRGEMLERGDDVRLVGETCASP